MRYGIRKCVLALSLVFAASFLFAQEGGGVRESDLYYYNMPIVRILEHPRGYYILYRTPSNGIGALCVPWEWFDQNDSRAIYAVARVGVQPYFSFITNNGEFYQIRINGSADKRDETWGKIGSARLPDENFDADSLTLKF